MADKRGDHLKLFDINWYNPFRKDLKYYKSDQKAANIVNYGWPLVIGTLFYALSEPHTALEFATIGPIAGEIARRLVRRDFRISYQEAKKDFDQNNLRLSELKEIKWHREEIYDKLIKVPIDILVVEGAKLYAEEAGKSIDDVESSFLKMLDYQPVYEPSEMEKRIGIKPYVSPPLPADTKKKWIAMLRERNGYFRKANQGLLEIYNHSLQQSKQGVSFTIH